MKKAEAFNEIVIICDQQSHWIWNTLTTFLQKHKLDYIQMDSDVSLRSSWNRIRQTPKFVIHWESVQRMGGAVIEELLEINPKFELEDRLLVVSSDPHPEDTVYFAELGITNVLELKNNHIDIKNSNKRLGELLLEEPDLNLKRSRIWRKLLHSLNQVSDTTPRDQLLKVRQQIEKVGELDKKKSARYFYALGVFHCNTGQEKAAQECWAKSLATDANYYPAKVKTIDVYCQKGEHQNALNILKQLQSRNKNNIARLVRMGEIHLSLHDLQKAEHYFKSALEKDKNCGSALNGLAAIRFEQGQLDESRTLLSKSSLASRVASTLNREGIILVREKKYEEALSHYQKAQYVLPQQDKSPMLFYNMGLCYSRWGKPQSAKQFLQIALIKEPNYKKAQKLLDQVNREAA